MTLFDITCRNLQSLLIFPTVVV